LSPRAFVAFPNDLIIPPTAAAENNLAPLAGDVRSGHRRQKPLLCTFLEN
jgi:hypothetical protein